MRLVVEATAMVLVAVVPMGAFYYVAHRPPFATMPSLVGRPAPNFALPSLFEDGKTLRPSDFRGQVWLLNLWASSCAACRLEHSLLLALSEDKIVPIVGLDRTADPDEARAWLKKLGNPYVQAATDIGGRVATALHVYGAPATFVIDTGGVIRFVHTGPLTATVLREQVIPLVRQLSVNEPTERSSSVN
jgi:cytochrome c biogenesis protein CcmG/thiol:disulfide interchange protein DsbE